MHGLLNSPAARLRQLGATLLIVASAVAISPQTARATDSLATPITGRMAKELWPIEVSVEVVRLGAEASRALPSPLRRRTIVVPDGHRLRFSSTVRGLRGRQRFDLTVVPRHHPQNIEFEWDLEVHEARFRPIGLTGYLKHRLHLGQSLELDEERLKIARSDIVSTKDDEIRIRFEIDGDPYEIRMLAATTRG